MAIMADFYDLAPFILATWLCYVAYNIFEAIKIYKHEASEKKAWQNQRLSWNSGKWEVTLTDERIPGTRGRINITTLSN